MWFAVVCGNEIDDERLLIDAAAAVVVMMVLHVVAAVSVHVRDANVCVSVYMCAR